MAYVRRRGNQLAIVQGEREPGTGKVQQRILFTLYSKAEVLEAVGRGTKGGAERFRHLLQREHPEVKFNWKAIRRALEKEVDVLPERYAYRPERLRGRFRADLCAFARQLMFADPLDLMSAAHLIQEHHHELEYLADLIHWRLELRDQKESKWNADNPFYWRFTLQGRDVPSDTEEHAAGFYERGEYERAEAVFQLLVDCFDGYAEGYNYLGLIALEKRKLDEALALFQKTAELGRHCQERWKVEHFEQSVAHVCETGGARRTWLRGLTNVAKRYWLQAAAHNLGALMRALYSIGTPRSLQGALAAMYALLCSLWRHLVRMQTQTGRSRSTPAPTESLATSTAA